MCVCEKHKQRVNGKEPFPVILPITITITTPTTKPKTPYARGTHSNVVVRSSQSYRRSHPHQTCDVGTHCDSPRRPPPGCRFGCLGHDFLKCHGMGCSVLRSSSLAGAAFAGARGQHHGHRRRLVVVVAVVVVGVVAWICHVAFLL